MFDLEAKRKKCLDAIERAMASIGFHPVVAYRERMVEYARQQGEEVCNRLIEEGRIDAMPEITAFWDEESKGPVVKIELPPGTLKMLIQYSD